MDILEQIIEYKRSEVEKRKAAVSVSQLEASPLFKRPTLSLKESLQQIILRDLETHHSFQITASVNQFLSANKYDSDVITLYNREKIEFPISKNRSQTLSIKRRYIDGWSQPEKLLRFG